MWVGVMGQWNACAVVAANCAQCYAVKKEGVVQRQAARGAFRMRTWAKRVGTWELVFWA